MGRKSWAMVAVALGASLTLAGCPEDGTTPGTCSLDFNRTFTSNFGDAEIDSLLEATAELNVAANAIESDVLGACNGISTDLGGASATDVDTACMNASSAIDAVLAANAMVTLTVDVEPAVCTVSVDAYADCVAECDASFDASATPPTCSGGMLAGECMAECMGSCTLEGTVDCEGSCEGSCNGTCDATIRGSCTGSCTGQCEGTCAAMDGDGNCMGSCDGTCRGTCDAMVDAECRGSCTGTCMGSCTADVTGSCEGTCTGMCSVDFVAPRCEGGDVMVMADADCQASCDADVSANATCTEPRVFVTYTGAADAGEMLTALADTLAANLPRLLAAAERAAGIADAATRFGNSLSGAVRGAASAGLTAAACVAEAVDVEIAAAAKIDVSVSASASVEASATGG